MLRNRAAVSLLVGAAVVNVGTWVYLALLIGPQEQPVFLHYNIYFGVDLIGAWYRIFYMPAIGTVILILNLLGARYMYRQEKAIGMTVLGITVFFELVLLLASLLIVGQNTL